MAPAPERLGSPPTPSRHDEATTITSGSWPRTHLRRAPSKSWQEPAARRGRVSPSDEATRLVVVSQGYVGLPLALRAVDVGFDVVGFDVDAERIKRLAAGDSYVEDIPDDRLLAALDSGRYEPTEAPDRIAGFDVAVLDVPTPLRDGVPNLSHVEDAASV